jgi:ABC-type multidrug transport system ATPase subunit
MKNTLEIDGVNLEFNSKRILNNVYLKSETGKITGLLGRNGTGKSSLMKIIFGELTPKDKSIRINGKSLQNILPSPSDIKYLPQTRFIPIQLSVKRVFKDFELNFHDFITHFSDFEKLYNSKLKNISGGQLRILEIYLILTSNTKFCLLDEPFSQVMPIYIETIKKLMLREKENKGIIITDHLYEHILDITDNIYLIKDGKTNSVKNLQDLESHGYIKETFKRF